MDQLLDEASASCGVPRARLSIAKPPTVGSKQLGPKLLAALKWDDPTILNCQKVGSYPLQLRDGDVLLFRDAEAAGGAAAKPSATAGAATKAGGRKGGGNKPWQQSGVVVKGGDGARRETGVKIHTVYDADAMPAAAPAGGGDKAIPES